MNQNQVGLIDGKVYRFINIEEVDDSTDDYLYTLQNVVTNEIVKMDYYYVRRNMIFLQ